jgi:rRNA maturation endonuclease Nob1
MRTYSRLYWNVGSDRVHRLTGVCSVCKKEYSNNNLFASSYCLECGKQIKKEKTRERVRKHREKKDLEAKDQEC